MRLRLLFASQKYGRSPRSSFLHYISQLSRCSLIFAPRGRLSPLFIKSGIANSRGGSFCSLGQESYRSLTRFARRLLFFPHHIPLIHGTATNSPALLSLSPLSPAIPSSLRFVLTTPAGCTTTPAVLHGGSFCSLGQESYRSLTRFARRLLFFPHHIPLIHGTATNSPALLSLSPLSPAIPSSLRFVLTTPAGCTTPE